MMLKAGANPGHESSQPIFIKYLVCAKEDRDVGINIGEARVSHARQELLHGLVDVQQLSGTQLRATGGESPTALMRILSAGALPGVSTALGKRSQGQASSRTEVAADNGR